MSPALLTVPVPNRFGGRIHRRPCFAHARMTDFHPRRLGRCIRPVAIRPDENQGRRCCRGTQHAHLDLHGASFLHP